LLNKKIVRAQSLVDAVAERLEAAIISGALEPGSKVKELVLAKSFGVSRGPLREAIRRLEGRRLLQRTPNVGVRVVALSVEDIKDILQVQQVLQGLACALAARNMGPADIEDLKKLLERYTQKESKGDDYDSRDLAFHSRIIAASRNPRLIQTLNEDFYFLLRVHRSKSSTTRSLALQVQEEHKAIVAAIARHDPVAAEEAMRRHIGNARDILNAVGADAAKGSPKARNRKSTNGRRSKQRSRAPQTTSML
jgi:DNA-binding GntR family transcriptional regulator